MGLFSYRKRKFISKALRKKNLPALEVRSRHKWELKGKKIWLNMTKSFRRTQLSSKPHGKTVMCPSLENLKCN